MTQAVTSAGGRQPDSAPAPPTPAPTPSPSRLRGWVRPLSLSLTTGALLYACHFPLAWGWLGWIALLPLLCLVRLPEGGRRIYVSAWLGGMLFFWAALYWMSVADYRMVYTWAMLATYCSLYFPLAIYFLRRLDRLTRLPLVVTVPVVWTALECFRANFGTGFAWYLLGYTQQANLPAIQIADLGGVYAVSFVVAAVNALVFEVLASLVSGPWSTSRQRRRWLPVQFAAIALLVGGTFGYGFWRLNQATTTPGPTLALLQGNLDQRIRNDATANVYEAIGGILRHYVSLHDEALRHQPRPDLIVWPETSYPIEWPESSYGHLTPPAQGLARQLWQRGGTDFLLGLNVRVDPDGEKKRYNSALLIGKGGRYEGQYDKIHRVPFGEYVPLRGILPFMNRFAPYDFDYSIWPGEHLTRFQLKDWRFGTAICFEDSDPELCRHYGAADADGPAVDFLVNISNDGWFDGSSEHEEHLALCRFRAIECRRALARAVNMGISAVLDGNGRVLALPEPTWSASKKVSAVLVAQVPVDHRTSLYALWGDWLPWLCGFVLLVGLTWSVVWPLSQGGTRPA
ncbi:MAG TPA: apolipoprotein N-acyltransferase [Gemmataceae bacterium]|nr:apolipoprotein N-acyltransferase [Gemmataceae bacterium]